VGGRFEVFDPGTGRGKVNAELRLVQRYGEELGLIFGNVTDHGTGPGEETTGKGTLTANTRISFVEVNGTFDVIGQIGGTLDSTAMSAVIQSAGCTDPYEQFAFDLPTAEGRQRRQEPRRTQPDKRRVWRAGGRDQLPGRPARPTAPRKALRERTGEEPVGPAGEGVALTQEGPDQRVRRCKTRAERII